ncbi:hypothetical protein [Nonomuraea helvata]|uniref:Uncharacterized protein n=1 Tax=Nonomuraea helvata TaxID=37484 RepID=A0ABV5RZ60_9ACTN
MTGDQDATRAGRARTAPPITMLVRRHTGPRRADIDQAGRNP